MPDWTFWLLILLGVFVAGFGACWLVHWLYRPADSGMQRDLPGAYLPVKALWTHGNLDLSLRPDKPQTDGVVLNTGDRVLFADQKDSRENGIYVLHSGGWSRSTDFAHEHQGVVGQMVYIMEGVEWAEQTLVTQIVRFDNSLPQKPYTFSYGIHFVSLVTLVLGHKSREKNSYLTYHKGKLKWRPEGSGEIQHGLTEYHKQQKQLEPGLSALNVEWNKEWLHQTEETIWILLVQMVHEERTDLFRFECMVSALNDAPRISLIQETNPVRNLQTQVTPQTTSGGRWWSRMDRRALVLSIEYDKSVRCLTRLFRVGHCSLPFSDNEAKTNGLGSAAGPKIVGST